MKIPTCLIGYFAALPTAKLILWCYLIWYLSILRFYFDPNPLIWLNSMGIAAIIGCALLLSVAGGGRPQDRWQVFRLFLMPFCVSSFSALIKDKGFVLIFPPHGVELLLSIGACLVFVGTVLGLKWLTGGRNRSEV